MTLAVTFDFGQTLAELDTELLAARCREQNAQVSALALELNVALAWGAYGRAKAEGLVGERAWSTFMFTLLSASGCMREAPQQRRDLVAWLWAEQRRVNLWRRPVPGMFELVRSLAARGVLLAVLSNSEGKLNELASELGIASAFRAIVDSGTLEFEKPDPRIFDHTAGRLGVRCADLIHVGDSWEADVRGAVAVGARAIYFSATPCPEPLEHAHWAPDAQAVGRVLAELGV